LARKVAKGLWAFVKWFVGTLCGVIAFVELAPRYEQLRLYGWSWLFLPLSSEEIIGIAAIAVGAVLIGWDILSRLRVHIGKRATVIQEPESQSTLIRDVKLDPRFEHVQVHVFWPRGQSVVIKRQDDFPQTKYVVNHRAKKAYGVGAYVWSLLVPYRQIEIHPETEWFPFYHRTIWCWKRHLKVVPLQATETDLLEGTNLMPLDSALLHLTIHYPRRTDTAASPTRPYYVANHSTNCAFWVPDHINALARQGRVQGARHDGEQALRDYFRTYGISPFERYPLDNELQYQTASSPSELTEEGAESVERMYEFATLRFDIRSTTDWIEIGLVDSTRVTIKNHNLLKGTVEPVEEPNSCHLRIDPLQPTFFVTATFEVYSGPLLVFLRKGDLGKVKVDILNKNGVLVFKIPETGKTAQKYNYKDFGFEFDDWD
jgi:hypothetical protein